jgi:glycosyltransferase involved in cell wall biosynthesis
LAIWPQTRRVHTTYHQVTTATGRLNSQNPNLQNIPIRTERGQEIRKAFVPRSQDYLLLSADYSQIELRIIAALSREPGLLEAFRSRADVHTATAARVFGVFPEMVTSEMRRKAKMVNYGIAYGHGVLGNLRRRPWLGLFVPALLASFVRAARAVEADLLHAHWLPAGWVAARSGKPYVVQVWGTDVAIAARAPALARGVLRGAQLVIAASRDLADRARSLGAREVRVVPSGVELPPEVGAEAVPPEVLYAGRLSPEKGVLELVEAAGDLNLVVAGDGPLRGQVPGAQGFVPHDELQQLYARAAVVVCLVVLGSAQVSADTTLIPRRALFADADRPVAALSPGGERIAYIEVQDATRSAWVAPADDPEARTRVALLDDGQPLGLWWSADGQRLLVQQQVRDGVRLSSCDASGAPSIDLTPIPGVSARLERLSGKLPGQALVALNDRDPRVHDLWKIDLVTAEKVLVMERTEFRTVHFDASYRPRVAEKSGAMTVGAWLTGTLMWNCCGPLKRLKSQAFTNRSSGSCPAVKVVCASCAAFTAKVMLAACTTPLTVKWPLVAAALLS